MPRRREVPEGSLYQRSGGRWWYKLRGKRYPCRPAGEKLATTRRGVAVEVARRIHRRVTGGTEGHRTITQVVEDWHTADKLACCRRHAETRKSDVLQFVTTRKVESVEDITPTQVAAWLGSVAEKRTPKTVANKRAALGRFCEWLVEMGELDVNPVRRTRPPKIARQEPVHLSRSELGRALRVAKRNRMWPVFFAAYTAARLGEIKRLQWRDIRQTPHGPVMVFEKTKTNNPRAVPITPRLDRVIRRMGRGRPDDLIFPARSRRWWFRYLRPIKREVPRMARKGGGWYDLRRTAASLMVQRGVAIYTVSKVLGHASVATTARYYAHLDAEAGREALAVF